jgi:hypothetical protein
MSLTQTYYLAHTARAKLSKEAARADHELRLLVGHANLLDGLMVDLADAEREQESWFNQSVRGASKETEEPKQPKHIQWSDSLPMVTEDYEAESSDDESEADEDEEISYARPTSFRKVTPAPITITTTEMEIDSEEEDEDEYEAELALTRTSSRTPPELLHESDSESEDDTMPPSPPLTLDSYTEKQFASSAKSQPKSLSPKASQEDEFYEEGFYLPQRQAVGVY